MALLTAKDLTFTYPNAKAPVLQEVSFEIPENAFVWLYGASGCGKTTLLRLLKKTIAPNGNRKGKILYNGKLQEELPVETDVREIAYTAQNPNTQQVSEYVKNELSFLPENLGMPAQAIQLQIAETVGFFGISDLYDRKISTLSGGEKQLVNLAAACMGHARLLLLDEPFAMLDAVGAQRFLQALVRLHTQLGVTVLLSEHNMQPVLPYLTQVLALEGGTLRSFSTADAFLQAYPCAVPSTEVAARLGLSLSPPPKTEAQLRQRLQASALSFETILPDPVPVQKNAVLSLKNASFRYTRDGKDVLRGLQLEVYRGSILTVFGANGSGKSTLLRLLSGVKAPYSGKRKAAAGIRIASVPQNPQVCFSFPTVAQICMAAAEPPAPKALWRQLNAAPSETPAVSDEVLQIAAALGVDSLLSQNAFDLSAGQQQRVALAHALLQNPDVVLLDEPTKGLDKSGKADLIRILQKLAAAGKAIVLVTHDLDFAAACADRCALLFDGQIVFSGSRRAYFARDTLYTSSVARMFAAVPPAVRPISMTEVRNVGE